MRKPLHKASVFKERRDKLKSMVKDSVLICASHPHYIRNNDVHYQYRQDSNFFYLTGFEEAESVFIFRPGQTPESILFVPPKDESKETWEGFRFGPEGAVSEFGMDAAYSIDELSTKLPELLKDAENIYFTKYNNREFDLQLDAAIQQVALNRSRTNKGNCGVLDPRTLLGELRLIKSPFEVEQMRKAAVASSTAHVEVMKACRPGVNERALYGVFLKSIMEQGCAREGYGGIFAGGDNATTLHYTFNDHELNDGEMFLIDAGGEYNYYSADITRTYPINGKFTEVQKRLYEKVLELQKSLVAAIKPGITRESLQEKATDRLTEIMIEEKLLTGSKDKLIADKSYLKFYMHGIGHWLGLDVHDTGLTMQRGEPRPIEAGYYLTIEPGIYIPKNAKNVPDELRGIGIRIEDDILVTETGNEVLTASCPKEVSELEAIIGTA